MPQSSKTQQGKEKIWESQNPLPPHPQNYSHSHSQSQSQNQSQSQSQFISKSQSHAQSPTHGHSRNPTNSSLTNSGVKIRPSRAYERSMSYMTKATSSNLSSSLIGYDDKSPSPLLEKKASQPVSKTRHAYVGKTEGDIHDQSGTKHSSISPQRVPVGRKTYYMGGNQVASKNILRTTGMSASKVLSTSGNSFILKKK